MSEKFVLEGYFNTQLLNNQENYDCWLVYPILRRWFPEELSIHDYVTCWATDKSLGREHLDLRGNRSMLTKEDVEFFTKAFEDAKEYYEKGKEEESNLKYFRVELLIDYDNDDECFHVLSYSGWSELNDFLIPTTKSK